VLPKFSFNLLRRKPQAAEELVHDGINTRCYSSWPTANGLLDAWNGLIDKTRQATAFHTPAWQYGVGRAYARVGRWRLITLSMGQHLLGTLPLTQTRNGVLETPGEMISDYLDPLFAEIDPQSAWQSILDLVSRLPGEKVNELVLHNVRHDAPSLAALREVCAASNFEITEAGDAAASRISLPGTWEDFLSKLGGHDRKELRRKLRKAEAAGARLEVHTSEPEVSADLDRIFSQMREVGGVKGIKAQWMYRPLFKRATPDLVRGNKLCTYNLMIGQTPAAGLICFPSADGPMMWAGGWNKELRELSPGIVLFGMAIRDSIEKKFCQFDLLRGQCRYKDELGAADYPLRRITLRRAA
jgi:CelD/BcsL family acetyltransferase involved in cellulose biosynthesis